MRFTTLQQPSAQPEQAFGQLPSEGKPSNLSFDQCLMVAKKHMLAGAGPAELSRIYGYSEKGMSKLLQSPYMRAMMGRLFSAWSTGAEEAAAIADAAAPVVMRRVVKRALPVEHGGEDNWEAQKFHLTLTMPRRDAPGASAPTHQAVDPVVVNQLFVGLREFKQLVGTSPAPSALLSERLLHGTEGIDLAETVASFEGQPTPAPTPDPAQGSVEGAPGDTHRS